jgi:hypothetical protein
MTHRVNEATSQTVPNQPAPGLIRTVALAGIGLISMIGDRLEAAYERSLERQSAAPGNRRNSGVSQLVFDEWESMLAHLNLPTKSDLDALSQQMTTLEKHIDQIVAQRAASQSDK